jgi:enamine deaminase RidA (YjgF/YER057c/UK114 family)
VKRAIHPLGWARPKGYSNGWLAQGQVLFIAGQIGWNPRLGSPKLPKGFAEQFEQALTNVLSVVREAGGRPEDLVRLTIYVTDLKDYESAAKKLGEIWRRHMGRHYPAMTLLEVSSLLERTAQVEIEGTAVL